MLAQFIGDGRDHGPKLVMVEPGRINFRAVLIFLSARLGFAPGTLLPPHEFELDSVVVIEFSSVTSIVSGNYHIAALLCGPDACHVKFNAPLNRDIDNIFGS